MNGVVFFPKLTVPCFELDTAVDPSNLFAVPYPTLERWHRLGQLEVMYVLDGIHADMERAIRNCRRIEPKRKVKLLAVINGDPIG